MGNQEGTPLDGTRGILSRAWSNAEKLRRMEKGTFNKSKGAIFVLIDAKRVLKDPERTEQMFQEAKSLIAEAERVMSEDEDLIAHAEEVIEEARMAIENAGEAIAEAEKRKLSHA